MFLANMDNTKISDYCDMIEKWAIKHQKGLILGGIIGFSLTSAYLLSQKKKKLRLQPKSTEPNLNMERYVFEILTDKGITQAIVETSGECYGVTLGGRYIGSMWRDGAGEMQWNTSDEELKPFLHELAGQLDEAFSRKGFASLLKGAYPEIISTQWKSSETLEVVISPDQDLEVFTTFLNDEASNLVDFDEHLDLIVKKSNDAYFVIVGIN
ncbi:hypothetical protein DU508_14100 [Pedobacter chinensis]|uniref:Uncharacterized protein n=1 Tax=Pedobacter chinensis TaxID=2282421 RepID=A0A369PTT4_9SPHI|nr:hypothetical protein [Pedobacter chinensis]RDC55983.1 hypothetical protein DU508_14100 [Pedobacter chinensis]